MSTISGLNLENVFLVLASYVLILLVNRKTSSESAVLLLAILTFHHVIAYLYAFHLSMPQNEVDPAGFMHLAQQCIDSGYCGYLGYHLYTHYLARVLVLGQSLYFVFLVNILFFVISLYYFIGISEFFYQKNHRKILIFFYGMWPSVVFFTTLHYRETFELYLLVAGVYFGLTGSKSDSFLRMLASMLLLLLMGAFHIKGLIFLSPVLFLILICYRLPLTFFSLGKKIVLLTVMCLCVYFAHGLYSSGLNKTSTGLIDTPAEKKIIKKIDSINNKKDEAERNLEDSRMSVYERNKIYQKINQMPEATIIDIFMKKVIRYRTYLSIDRELGSAFISTINAKSIPVFIATYFLVYLEYLFSPFIFQVNSFLSLLAYAESLLRLSLFIFALIMLKRSPQPSILFIIYLAITSMWAVGVVSFGSSIRHHVMTNWILVLLGIPIISEYVSKKYHLQWIKKDIIS